MNKQTNIEVTEFKIIQEALGCANCVYANRAALGKGGCCLFTGKRTINLVIGTELQVQQNETIGTDTYKCSAKAPYESCVAK
jgi:hypothetical protein